MTFFFMFVPLSFGLLFSLAWLLVADVMESATRVQLARAYGIVGAASILGGVAGGGLAGVLAPLLDAQFLILVGAACLAACVAEMAWAQARFPRARGPGQAARKPGLDDLKNVLKHPYSAGLLAIGVAAALGGVLIEFQFYLAATTAGHAGRGTTSFFAGFYFLFNLLALVAQLFIMPRLQNRFGVHGSLLVLPGALVFGVSSLFVNSTLLTRSLLRVVEGGVKSSIHRSNWEQAYLPLGRAQRAAAKIVVDGVASRMGEGIAAGLVFIWLRAKMVDQHPERHSVAWITWLLLGIGVVWLSATLALRRRLCASTESGEAAEWNPDVPLPDY
jgi:AAA family ATP:ADP antiporter